MLDMMSGGRLVFGVGSGYLAHEFVGYDREPAEKRERFNENLDLVRRLLAGETLRYEGKYVGRQKNRIFTVPYASCRDFADVGRMLEEYRKGLADAGLRPDDDDHVFTLHTHVAASDEEARHLAKAAYDLYVDARLYARKHVYEDIIANGINLFGSVQTVAGKMRELHAMGIRHVATMHNFGALDPELVERSMTLFAREVMGP
jgi:alkanesulfonate monooxygenase SsuD/methylene tetrahydromethanopterin reductase-like flavin-dependent oxidoreductase (luciferase family)